MGPPGPLGSPGPRQRQHQGPRLTTLAPDPPHGVYPANPPRAGRQQGYAGSDGCAGGPPITGEDELMAAAASEREGATPVSGSSLALYRKYRPATFAEVKGQEHVTGPLRQAL